MIYGVSHYTLDIQSRNYDTFLSNNPLRQVIWKSLPEICHFVVWNSEGFQESHYEFKLPPRL